MTADQQIEDLLDKFELGVVTNVDVYQHKQAWDEAITAIKQIQTKARLRELNLILKHAGRRMVGKKYLRDRQRHLELKLATKK